MDRDQLTLKQKRFELSVSVGNTWPVQWYVWSDSGVSLVLQAMSTSEMFCRWNETWTDSE